MKHKRIVVLLIILLFGILIGCQSTGSQIPDSQPLSQDLITTTASGIPIIETDNQYLEVPESSISREALPSTESTSKINKEPEKTMTKDLAVHFIDVGQADSIFAELPNGEVMLIDAGNLADAELVFSYIDNLGYKRLDYVVATHPHEDHIGGMAKIIEQSIRYWFHIYA